MIESDRFKDALNELVGSCETTEDAKQCLAKIGDAIRAAFGMGYLKIQGPFAENHDSKIQSFFKDQELIAICCDKKDIGRMILHMPKTDESALNVLRKKHGGSDLMLKEIIQRLHDSLEDVKNDL